VITAQRAYDVIRQAIIDRHQIVCFYNGFHRYCCPHTIGRTNGTSRVLVYQFGGNSSSGLPAGGEWRCMDIPAMTGLKTISGPWHTDMRHSKQQTCVKHVDLDITMT